MATKKKPPSKKKRTARSKTAAAKKGWVTRRMTKQTSIIFDAVIKAREAESAEEYVSAMLTAIRLGKKPQDWEVRMAIDNPEQLKEILHIERTWVSSEEPEFLHTGKRGEPGYHYPKDTIALYPSRARWMGKLTDWALKKLRGAYATGGDEDSPEFRRAARVCASTMAVTLREIYTLWHSP